MCYKVQTFTLDKTRFMKGKMFLNLGTFTDRVESGVHLA
jgi:hypothetical protein